MEILGRYREMVGKKKEALFGQFWRRKKRKREEGGRRKGRREGRRAKGRRGVEVGEVVLHS